FQGGTFEPGFGRFGLVRDPLQIAGIVNIPKAAAAVLAPRHGGHIHCDFLLCSESRRDVPRRPAGGVPAQEPRLPGASTSISLPSMRNRPLYETQASQWPRLSRIALRYAPLRS